MCWANHRQDQNFRDCQKWGGKPERTFKAKDISCKESKSRGRCHTKNSCHGDSPGQSPKMEMSRPRLQILISGKNILGNRNNGKGIVPSHGQETIAQNLWEIPLWLYRARTGDLDKVLGLLVSFFSPQAIFLQLVHVIDPQQCLRHGKFVPAGL